MARASSSCGQWFFHRTINAVLGAGPTILRWSRRLALDQHRLRVRLYQHLFERSEKKCMVKIVLIRVGAASLESGSAIAGELNVQSLQAIFQKPADMAMHRSTMPTRKGPVLWANRDDEVSKTMKATLVMTNHTWSSVRLESSRSSPRRCAWRAARRAGCTIRSAAPAGGCCAGSTPIRPRAPGSRPGRRSAMRVPRGRLRALKVGGAVPLVGAMAARDGGQRPAQPAGQHHLVPGSAPPRQRRGAASTRPRNWPGRWLRGPGCRAPTPGAPGAKGAGELHDADERGAGRRQRGRARARSARPA